MLYGLYGYDGVSGCCSGRGYNPTGAGKADVVNSLGDCGCGCDGTSILCKVKDCAPYAAVAVGVLLFLGVLK